MEGNMARAELREAWTLDMSVEAAKQRVEAFVAQQGMMLAPASSDDGMQLVAVQGSQVKTRTLGGWFAKPKEFPKRATISLNPIPGGVRIEAHIEETLGVGWLDPQFRKRYNAFFAAWMVALRETILAAEAAPYKTDPKGL
jgi:hypothetical protein